MMMTNALHESILVRVDEPSAVGEARRTAKACAARVGLQELAQERLALIATEAANNLVQHGGGGEVLLRCVSAGASQGVEFLALDKGPGMTNPSLCLKDGFSTRGTTGAGLGSIVRNADAFDLFSAANLGTVVWATVWGTPPPGGRQPDVGVVCVAKRGEAVSGDGWSIATVVQRSSVLLVDGLGHGEDAANAAHRAIRIHEEKKQSSPKQVMSSLTEGLRGTRGAAAGVAVIDSETGTVCFAGVGNIVAATVGAARHSFPSQNGIVGAKSPPAIEFECPWQAGDLLVMHSDGVSSRWDLGKYPGLTSKRSPVVAGIIYRDFSRPIDDATVVVTRGSPA